MTIFYAVLLFVLVQRILELTWSRHNEAWLRADGGVEHGARHYPLFFIVHGGWWAAMWIVIPSDASPVWPLLGVFFFLQFARVWTIASLGRYWTTRLITLPSAPLVRAGPYRWMRHPNYVIVMLEIAVLPLAFGAWEIALVFSIANGFLLAHRIRMEERILASRR
jgi:methyltransferase